MPSLPTLPVILDAILAPAHLFAYSTLLGTQLYQSFVMVKVAYQALPPEAFTTLQKRVFPLYFFCQSALVGVTAITFPHGPLALIKSKGDWIPFAVAMATAVLNTVEQKIDGIVASLVKTSTTDTGRTSTSPPERPPRTTIGTHKLAGRDRPTAPGSWLMFPESFEEQTSLPDIHEPVEAPRPGLETEADVEESAHDRDFVEQLRNIHDFGDKDAIDSRPTLLVRPQRKSEPPINDEQVQSLLSNGEAENLLSVYRSMCITFPFVPIDDVLSAAHLHATKPMLFLAIITVAAWDNHKLQRHLDRVYRKELADHTYIRPRRTMQLLQSVLVYLSRYHFVFSHKTQQIYFMQTTANGLALDLELHQKSTRPLMDFPGRPSPSPLSVTEQLERQRTFLGCYYLSSQVATGMQRPNLLKYTEYMGQCSKDLQDHRQYPSDAIIGHLLAIRRLDDQIHECFFTEETVALDITDPRISMNFRFLESQLDQWKRERYSDEYQILFDLASAYTDMQLHSIALRAPQTSHQGYMPDSTRLNALLATLEACKRFFDTLLACPPSNYHILAFSEWFRIPVVVMTLARLCIPSDTHTAALWDVKAAHERGRLDLYLESLCYRMKGLSTYKRTQSFHHDFYWALEMIMDLTKSWFVNKISGKKTPSNGIPTPDTMQSLTHGLMADGSGGSSTHAMPETGGCPYAALDQDTSMNGDIANDPLGFMRDADFDMDK
ncbi:uncharacterized protein N0V89_003434 [Didymosphaeria variabile]|uniref:Transcription factor domain-containing protein n=1 Tax=Didymosphaeria variabile TaxID=1932322 RepID=A0A9W9CCA8_9PLEO|nr:uncharacterized protein N0V89_003434 [Didymosphaeria variabile]KAJ4355418.1 hypothetical protein N0V89_003434 [Didymosphaeria variabile]